MKTAQTGEPTPRKPLRLWPGLALVTVQWLLWFVVPPIVPGVGIYSLFGAVFASLLLVVWWLFFSRAPWVERVGALAVMIAAPFATRLIIHESISDGMMGNMPYVYSIPLVCFGMVAWAAATRRSSDGLRRASMVPVILLASATLALIRTGGITGDAIADIHWRWSQTPEEKLLAQASDEPAPIASAAAPVSPQPQPTIETPAAQPRNAPVKPGASSPEAPPATSATEETHHEHAAAHASSAPEWPGFRGPNRDGIVRGVTIDTDWSKSPPVQLWRRPIGPGWSSFAVHGDLFYTQEQRGEDEIVACYKVSTGEPVWRHRDHVRFWESNGGAGPRATPTLSNGRVYAFGATGILNVLDAGTGAVVWSRDVATDTETETPGWGFASSPLVIGDVVIVAADARLVGYEIATGQRRWIGPVHHGSYSSPHRATFDGVDQVVLLGGAGVQSLAPATGEVLWEYAWRGVVIVQPGLTPDGDLLVNSADAMGGLGVRRLAVKHGAGGWTVEERWTSRALKPYFNDFVVHKGYAYGFDGNILACIDLADGNRKWKGGRYGNGQLVLLPDQDVLLVLSEEGELALVGATPDQFKELARFPALDSKTWNHPVLVGDVLLVRNGEEMAAFRLSLARR